jgi:hypothetical protein
MNMAKKNAYRILLEKPEETRQDQHVGVWTILKWILRRSNGIWIELIWLKIGASGGHL